MDKLERAKQIYQDIGESFLKFSERMDEKLLADIESGVAEAFWCEEIKRELWSLREGVEK
jgi:hypothetical protein